MLHFTSVRRQRNRDIFHLALPTDEDDFSSFKTKGKTARGSMQSSTHFPCTLTAVEGPVATRYICQRDIFIVLSTLKVESYLWSRHTLFTIVFEEALFWKIAIDSPITDWYERIVTL